VFYSFAQYSCNMAKEIDYINSPPEFDSSGMLTEGRHDRLKKVLAAYANRARELVRDPRSQYPEVVALETLVASFLPGRVEALKDLVFMNALPEVEATKAETDPWLLLMESEKTFAHEVTVEMATYWGLDPSDFSLIRTTDKEGNETFTITLSTDEGIDSLGITDINLHPYRCWQNARQFRCYENGIGSVFRSQIQVAGKIIDMRSGVTDATLFALSRHNPNITNEAVWRIGHPGLACFEQAPIALLNKGKIYFYLLHEDSDSNEIRLRPSTVIAQHQKSVGV
jgi:hypothetical protein